MDMKHYLMNVYKEHYGEHINEHLAKCIVKDMAITDGSDRENGEKYTMENAVEIGQKMGIDFDKIKKLFSFVLPTGLFTMLIFTVFLSLSNRNVRKN